METRKRNVLRNAAIVVAIVSGFSLFFYTLERKLTASDAIWEAVGRMRKAEPQDDLAVLVIACSNTQDPLACIVTGKDEITVTYFKGDNQNREPYAMLKVRVERNPQLVSNQIHFK